MFDLVVLWKKLKKIVGIVCHPCQIIGLHPDAAYMQRVTGEGPSYQSVHQQRVRCLDGAADLEAGSLESHRQKKKVVIHSVSWEITPPTDPPTMAPITYHVSLPRLVRSIACPEEGCQGRVMIHTNFHIYFDYWHVRDTVAILGEGKRPHQ